MEYNFEELPVGLSCHPSQNCFAAGFIDGSVALFSYAISEETSPQTVQITETWKRTHKAAVRKLRFSHNGDSVYSLTRNKAFTHWDTETGKKLRCIRVAHDSSPYSMHVINENQVATGDEDGTIKFWDWRSKENPCIFQITEETDEYITDMTSGENGKILLATCGDCTLISIDTRKKKLIMQSETMHSELLSIACVSDDKKVICGAADSYLEVFNWGEWGNIVERISTDHTDTVDCLIPLTDNLLATGSADGTIRSVNVLPNKCVGIIGRHDEGGVEDLSLTFDGNYLISCGQDGKVKFWNVNNVKSTIPKTKSGSKLKKSLSKKRPCNFFDELEVKKVSKK